MPQDIRRRDFLAATAAAPALARGAAAKSGNSLVSFRIGTALWLTDERFQDLMHYFGRFPGMADELAFFTSETHPPLPLEVMEQRAERLAKLMPQVRKLGMRAGINVLATMGHHAENLPNSLAAPWQRVMDIHGRISAGSFCPAQPELVDYARKVYAAMAKASPDFIWLDDDIRLAGHGPVTLTCFCDRCLANFSRETRREFTRETLPAVFDSGTLEERMRWRARWLEHNRATIDNLFREIEQAVHALKPGLTLGFMTGDRFWEGYGFARWTRTLSGPGHAPVMWRPGGGFYSDERPIDLVGKAHDVGRQVAALPPDVTVIQSELENFPYQRLRKAAHTTVVEASAHMAAGTTGTAFNVLNMRPDPLDEYLPLGARISATRPFYELLRRELGRSRTEGLWPAWNSELIKAVNPDGKWLDGGRLPLAEPYTLGEIGIPICYDFAGRSATALSRTAPLAFTREQLQEIFASGVLMDVDAWQTMERLGLAGWTGVRAVKGYDVDVHEELSKHPLNGRFAGWSRDCRQSFWKERAWALEPASEKTAALALLRDYGEKELGTGMTAFENELGGRVVVMGYYPWTQVHSLAKSSQMKAIVEWASNGRVPAMVESYSRISMWCRSTPNGKRAIVLLNTSLDPAEPVELRVKAPGTAYMLHPMSGPARPVKALAGRIRLPRLEPWNIYLLVEA
ncbi:MAG: hypothetical protein LLG20_16285 [Acidobacteriales bacterium]|nr:hypothetical protein [Terriglobales bacterium]